MTDKALADEDISCRAPEKLCRGGGRAGGDVSDDSVRRRAEILQKAEACTARIRVTQARIEACYAAGLDASDDERWMATELELLGILVDVLKALKGPAGTN
jgi:hypothetical protein